MKKEKEVPHRDPQRKDIQRCGAMQVLRRRASVDPEYRRRRRIIEREVNRWLTDAGRAGGRSAIITIPIVIHVVWKNEDENISDAQIHNQIDILNEDFRRLNDISDVPSDFASVSDDTLIQFALAERDPDCQPTDGITRTETDQDSWADFSDAMKSASTGGIDPWPTDQYLNIWVISNQSGSFIGWAEFPGGPADVDGVVIRHGAFGSVGTAGSISSAFDGGRTATHEIGHWLNLIHIWGGSGSSCGDSDNVDDTPNQDGSNAGCPSHPHTSCESNDMFMNYMDYVDDSCMRIFSVGQVDRMHATLATARPGILASDGLVPPPPDSMDEGDLWMRDTADDDGAEPNTSDDPVWLSPDIWIRRQDDGMANQEHENPLYRPPSGDANYVYVRVRNRACEAAETGTLKLYWAKASSGLSWPEPWDGSITTPAVMGGFIDQQSVTVSGGDTQIVQFAWRPPDPDDYASFGADRGHFCLLARIETASSAPFGMTTPETGNLSANVKNNNNIAWKNVTVVDSESGGGRMESMLVTSPHGDDITARLSFDRPGKMGLLSAFDWAWILIKLPPRLRKKWEGAGTEGHGLTSVFDDWMLVEHPGAELRELPLEAHAFHTLDVQFIPKTSRPRVSGRYALHVSQYEGERLIGGVTFEAPVAADRPRRSDLGSLKRFNGINWQQGHVRLDQDRNRKDCCCCG